MKIEIHKRLTIGNTTVLKFLGNFILNSSFVPKFFTSPYVRIEALPTEMWGISTLLMSTDYLKGSKRGLV